MEHRAHRGLSWDHKTGKGTALMAVIALIASLFIAAAGPATANAAGTIDVVVREANPVTDSAERLVERVGGIVKENLGIIGGFTATVPADMVSIIESDPSVSAATPNGTVQFSSAGWEDTSALGSVDFKTYAGSLYQITRTTKATQAWGKGYLGLGVDVALIDTGVSPVAGLPSLKVVQGADLSFESQNPDFEHLDTNGHGTHLAGIIGGLNVPLGEVSGGNGSNLDRFVGIAPGSRIVNVKVGSHDGAVDVSQVIAAIDWVVEHRNDNGLNIRVLNLAFGTDSTQSRVLDPLSFAVEQAWKAGIVVVVAAGNDGNNAALRNPATNPFVIAVGSGQASNFNTGDNTRVDYDALSSFSNCGTTQRGVDLLAPGKSIASLRTPGSYADTEYPKARIGGGLFLGSGTSQATAVVSGAAALVVGRWPSMTPDQVKHVLTSNAEPRSGVSSRCQGAGMIDLSFLSNRKTPSTRGAGQSYSPSTGTGSLEASRGTDHLENGGVVLAGEQDIFGHPFDSRSWSTASAQGTSWSGGTWNGTSWSGTSWSGTWWSGLSWSGTSWSGTSWSGLSWSGLSWSNKTWSGTSWSGTSWSGTSWSGTSWSGLSWSSSGSAAANGVRWD